MKNFIYIILSTVTIIYTCYYMKFGGIWGNKSALSKVGITHPILFAVWGLLTFITISVGVILAMNKYKFHFLLLSIALLGMILTIICDFDYSNYPQYLAHCIGSLTFSVVMSVTIFLTFLLNKNIIFSLITAIVMLSDLVLLLIFKETALIETVPIFIGIILLNAHNFRKDKRPIEINK